MEMVVTVDRYDHKLGEMERLAAHTGSGTRHRAVSVFLFNQENKLLIHKRSREKIVAAGLWANTCCGNVRPGESRIECAKRRLREELGIEGLALTRVCQFSYQVACESGFAENEIDRVYIGTFNGEPVLNPKEVEDVSWVDPKSWGKPAAPWVRVMKDKGILRRVLQKRKEMI